MDGQLTVFVDLLILIGSATFVATVFHYLHVPTIVGFIIAGVIIGPYGLKLVNSVPGAHLLTEIGIVLLLFSLGLEFSFRRLKELRTAFLKVGGTQVLVTVTVTAWLAYFVLHIDWTKALFFGFLLALSSTAIIIKLLQDSRELESPYGQCVIGVLLFQDIAVIGMMLALPLLLLGGDAKEGLNGARLLAWVGQFSALILFIWSGSKYIIPFILRRVVATRSRELFFFSIIFVCALNAFFVASIGFSLSLGAFVGGMMISGSPYGRQITADIVPMRDNFLALFFTSVGMLLDPVFLLTHLHRIVGISLLIFAVKGCVVWMAARISRYPKSVALISALMLCQIGEFSFILAERGMHLGLLTVSEQQYFLAVSILSMMWTPFIYRKAPHLGLSPGFLGLRVLPTLKSEKALKAAVHREVEEKTRLAASQAGTAKTCAHTLIIGFGIAGQSVASALRALEIPYQIIEMNHETVERYQKKGEPILYGDATKTEILEHADISTAHLVVLTISGRAMNNVIIEAIRTLRPDIRTIVRAQYMRDLNTLPQLGNSEIVVGEFETTLEILARALNHYGVDTLQIHEFLNRSRKHMVAATREIATSLREIVGLPNWETLSLIRPVTIAATDHAVDQSLADLKLRAITGCSAVSVFRDGLGTTIPDAEFILQVGDVVHLIGSDASHEQAADLLHTGRVQNNDFEVQVSG